MVIEILCLFGIGILLGIIIGLLAASPIIRQKMLEVELHWKNKLAIINSNWSQFHTAEEEKWVVKTRELIIKTAEDRDRAWEKKLSGVKQKSKPPN